MANGKSEEVDVIQTRRRASRGICLGNRHAVTRLEDRESRLIRCCMILNLQV
jgi:hypothetical protein